MTTFDIAIIGGGPAGCACALALHGSGLRVAILEKEAFPRDKICGDAIPSPAFKVMDRLSPAWGQQMRQWSADAKIKSARMFVPGRRSLGVWWVNYSYNAARLDFDQCLMELVKKETETIILENKQLQTITTEENGLQCRFKDGTTISAGMVVGCDGAYSTVSRQLGGVDLDERNNCVAIRAYYRGVSGMTPGENELHFLPKLLPGYLWIFPLANGMANVGFGMLKKAAAQKKIKLRTILDQLPEYAPELAARLQGAERLGSVQGFALPLHTGRVTMSGSRYLLCGDAAALVDPLQGHGIDHAMTSGVLAAQHARQCFVDNDFSAAKLQAYDLAIRRGIGVELSRNALVLRLVTQFPFLMRTVGWLGYFEKPVNWLIHALKL